MGFQFGIITTKLPVDFEFLILCTLVTNGIMSPVVAWVASKRGRSAFGWFLISFIFSPILAAIGLLVVGPRRSSRGDEGQ